MPCGQTQQATGSTGQQDARPMAMRTQGSLQPQSGPGQRHNVPVTVTQGQRSLQARQGVPSGQQTMRTSATPGDRDLRPPQNTLTGSRLSSLGQHILREVRMSLVPVQIDSIPANQGLYRQLKLKTELPVRVMRSYLQAVEMDPELPAKLMMKKKFRSEAKRNL
jgi:hypothetical protein